MKLGLSSRLTVTVVLVVVALQAVSMLAFLRLQQADENAWRLPVPVRIAAAADALDRLPADRRDEVLVALNGDATRFVIAAEPPEGYRERAGPLPILLRSFGAALEGRDVRLLWPEDREWRPRTYRQATAYGVSVALADGQRLVVTPGLTQRRRGIAMAALTVNFLAALAAAVLVWRMVRRATRDFEAIADASARFAVDLSAPVMHEGRSAEARKVAAAFNQMRARIQGLMNERMRMLAAVAHDLKTLLTRLRLRVVLIDDNEQRARADRDIALMATLIEDVLMVARGEEKTAPLVWVDVSALITDMVHERTLLGQAVTISLLDGGLVKTDPFGLRRIVENLVENAVAYAGSAEVRFEREGGRWRVLVVDHGPGLPEGFADRAFEPFERGEGSRSRDTGGAGLGLSIARTLAHQMGGAVELQSTEGGGLTAVVHSSRPPAG